jgi:penicillin amidase
MPASPRPFRPRRSRLLRWSSYVAGAVALLLVTTAFASVWAVRRPLPDIDGTQGLPGLDAEVTVLRDAHGIPQIYGDSVTDLMRAQGYVAAQDRFFEMDVRRHATAGRLAELFGEAALDSDKVVRTMGWRRVAQAELALLDPDTRTALEAYAAGVNAYLDEHGPTEIAVQYTVLGLTGLDYHPEPWTPVDSLAWLKAMAWDLRGNMDDEIQRILTEAAVGSERAKGLWPAYPFGEHAPILSRGAVVDGAFDPEAEAPPGRRTPARPAPAPAVLEALRGISGAVDAVPAWLGRGDGLGSNSWVVSGDHTETGEPLLANDPHLGVSLPGVWLQVGLHCRTVTDDCPLDVAGFSFSGVPGVVIGHNAHIAWGFTNLDPDVTDLYVERVRDGRWQHGRGWRALDVRTETIRVRGGDDVTLTVRSTAHGPILSDVALDAEAVAETFAGRAQQPQPAGTEYAVSLAWTALSPRPTADAILALDVATDWESFRAAAADFAVPAQNLVYADTEGHIGYQAPGVVPVRGPGHDGTRPVAGWRPRNDWVGTVPFEALPHALDPAEGWIVTANQAVVDTDGYPHRLTDDWDRGYRSQRIRDRLIGLVQEGRVTVEDLARLQLESEHPLAESLVPRLLDIDLPAGYWSAGQRALLAWDGQQRADSAGAAYLNAVWRHVLALTFHDELPEDLWPDGEDRWIAVVEGLLDRPDDLWWDDLATDGVIEDRDDVLEAAQRAARDEVTRLTGLSSEDWEWGRLHRLELREQTLGESGIGPVEWLVNRGDWRLGGGTAAVEATGWVASEGYAVQTAPSMRMVVSMADLDASRWVNLTGVSGHPASPHYVDQTDLWTRGETLPWLFSRERVEDAAEATLTLTHPE